MSKKLTASAVTSASKKAYTMKSCHLTDINGEVWDLNIDKKMSPTKVIDMAKESIIFVAKLVDEGVEDESIVDNSSILWYIGLLKNFTDINIPEKKTAKATYSSYLSLLDSLINLNLLEKIIQQFDLEALKRTEKEFVKLVSEINEFTSQTMKELAENKDIENDNGSIDEDVVDLVVDDTELEDEIEI